MWRWTLETERSRETAVTWVAVAAWRQAVVFYGSLSWYRAAGCSVLSGGALAWAVVAASRTRMCSRIVAMTSGFSMRAMTRSLPPHLGQVWMSMAKTRFGRRIQVMGARGLSGFSWRGSRFGTTDSRCLQFGANTPWNRVRFNRGRGTNAARRSGVAITMLIANTYTGVLDSAPSLASTFVQATRDLIESTAQWTMSCGRDTHDSPSLYATLIERHLEEGA